MTDRSLERAVARRELLRRLILLSLLIFAASVGLGLLGLSLQIRQTQTDGTPTGKRIVALQETINDCVNPKGECFKRGQARTADAIATLNLGALYAVYCVDHNPSAEIAKIQACVRRLYDENAGE